MLVLVSATLWAAAGLVWRAAIAAWRGRRPGGRAVVIATVACGLLSWMVVPVALARHDPDDGASFAGLWPIVLALVAAGAGVVALLAGTAVGVSRRAARASPSSGRGRD